MRIAVDAMGSDKHPVPDVAGSVLAARETGDTILLVGDERIIKRELDTHERTGLKFEIVHTDEAVAMADIPSVVLKGKPNSSMHKGMNLVKNGQADCFVTAGNTGAVLAIATLGILRRIPGVKRPALSAIYPVGGVPVTFLDIGANADAKTEWLVQFALMGNIYSQKALGLTKPRVALLSNGEEEGKGNLVVREAGAILRELDLHYIGNAEPKEVMTGQADVVVTDGFVGNIFVKMFEAAGTYFGGIVREELNNDLFSKLGAVLAYSAFKRVRARTDTSTVGGAPLLGVNGVVIIAHGGSNEIAVKNAIHQARKAIEGEVIEAIQQGLATLI